MTPTKNELNAVLRSDLTAFTEKVFPLISAGDELSMNWHLQVLGHHLQEAAAGNIKRLIITLPPRHLKSIFTSVALPAWILGRDPTRNILCVNYSEKLAGKHARDFRTVVESKWYRDLFPTMRPHRRKNAELEFVTTRNGGRLATSVEGTLTGRGGNFLFIDDPVKPGGAMSEAERNNVNDWFNRTAYSRLNNKKEDVIVITMQRLHEADLVGHVLEFDDWTVVDIPAIATERSVYRYGNRSDQTYTRQVGEVIDPRREDSDELEKIKKALGSDIFSAQYQQNPLPAEGNMVKLCWLKPYDDRPADENLWGIIHSWDTAAEAGELNDYSVCTVWGVIEDEYYLLDVVRERLEYPDLKKRAIALAARDNPQVIVIERAGTGRTLAQDLRRDTNWIVKSPIPQGDKQTRLAGQSALIEDGRVFLPCEAPWREIFLKEVLSFPNSKHDDQVDSLELFLRFMRKPQGIYPGARRGESRPRPPGRNRPEGWQRRSPRPRTYSLRQMEDMIRRRGSLI